LHIYFHKIITTYSGGDFKDEGLSQKSQ